jgi:cyclophilin family peptidyl-prolyl cis-trans isomerase
MFGPVRLCYRAPKQAVFDHKHNNSVVGTQGCC